MHNIGDKVKVQGKAFEFADLMLGGNEGVIVGIKSQGYIVKFPKGNTLYVKESEIVK